MNLYRWGMGMSFRGGGYMNVSDGVNNAYTLTAGLGLRVWYLYMDLAAGVSPNRAYLNTAGKEVPERANLSGVLGFKGTF